MLEKPDLPDENLIACLQDAYGLLGAQVTFLPFGADLNTAVYRAVADDYRVYFVKVRRGVFDETSVVLPKWLSDQGIKHLIAPLTTTTGQLWARLDAFTVILYPFVEGHGGFEVALVEHHWYDFGATLRRIHTAVVSPALTRRIPRETFSAQGRRTVTTFLSRLADDVFDDPVAQQLAAFLTAKRDEILDLVGRADRLAQALQARPLPFIVCHADLHAGNILIDVNDHLYLVDWDTPMFAPKEHDLMFIGGGQGFVGHAAQEEESLFYQGYGPTEIDPGHWPIIDMNGSFKTLRSTASSCS